MKVAIIINAKRLTPELKQQLDSNELSQKYNLTYDVFLPEPQEVEALVNKIKSQSYNMYLIGGGDGTVRSVAQVLAGTDAVISILPIGTFNLLAKTLKYPTNLDEMFALIKNGKTKQIDLIEVNNLIVINHAWVGFYFYILKMRKKHRAIIGKNKLLKIIFNTFNLFSVLPIYSLTLTVEGQQVNYKTCLLYIGNNEYGSHLLDLVERKTVSSGLISVTILNCKTRWQLFLCMLGLIFSKAKDSPYVIQFATNELTVSAKSNLINIVLDGELFKLETPLKFTNHHKTLTVMVP